MKNILEEKGHTQVSMWDPYIDDSENDSQQEPMIYFIGTKHPDFITYSYNQGSIIIDPWRYISEVPGCKIISIGMGKIE